MNVETQVKETGEYPKALVNSYRSLQGLKNQLSRY